MAAWSGRGRVVGWAARAIAGLLATAGPAAAQDAPRWPARTVTIVVPFSAGGTTDMFARILAQDLQAKHGQSFVVENQAGAGGNVGTARVARAAPDGHTVLVGTVSTHAINPFLYKNLAHDTVRDFQPVSLIARLPNLLVVSPKLGAASTADLIAKLKGGGELRVASSGVGTSGHLAAELFQMRTGAKMTHVPYRNSAEAVQSILGGHVDLAFENMTMAWPQARDGGVTALGVTSAARSPTAPNVPTIAETVEGFDATSWHGVFVPAATPRPIVDALAAEVKRVFEGEAVRAKLTEIGAVPAPTTPEAFVAFIEAERAKWREVVRMSGAAAP